MNDPNAQTQAFGDIALSGQGHSLTITQLVQPSPAAVQERPFVAGSPYLGLQRFEEQHRELFFGREVLAAELLATVTARPFTLVLGASGSGKSSLVQAGLIPLLRQRLAKLRVFSLVPDRDPFDSLRAALVHGGCRHRDADAAHARQADTLLALCQNPRLRRPGEPWLLFVDQFEEVFTRQVAPAVSAAFLEGFVRLVEAALPEVHVVVAMRADFFDRFDPHPRLLRLVRDNWQPITSPDVHDLRACIEQPAARHGVCLEEGLVETILRDLAGQAGGLPLLQYTLDRLWQDDAPSEARRMLRLHSYQGLGGVRGALRQRADALYEYRDPLTQEPRSGEQREAMRRVFLRLVDLSDAAENARPVSQRMPLAEFSAEEQRLIVELADEKLLVTARSEAGVATVEVVHEALLQSWPQLQLWITQGREAIYVRNRLSADARIWHAAKQAGGLAAEEDLWRGSRLAQAKELAEGGDFDRLVGQLPAPAAEFLAASLAEQERQAERERQRQRDLAEAVILAREQQYLAEQRELDMYVEQGRQLLVEKERPVEATLWLHRSYERGARHPMLPYLLADAMRPVDSVRAVLQGHSAGLSQASFSLDGRRVVTASEDHTARIWDGETGALLAVLEGHRGAVVDARFSDDGRLVVTAGRDLTARVWELESYKTISVLSGHTRALIAARFSPDGHSIVTCSVAHRAQLWNTQTGQQLFEFDGHNDQLIDAAFSPSGRLVVTASLDHTAQLWDRETRVRLGRLRGHTDQVWHASFSPDSRRVVTASRDRTARLWDAETRSELVVLHGHTGVVGHASFSPDGRYVLTASGDHTARVWDAATGRQIRVLQGHSDWVAQANFSPDGHRIVTASYDHTAKTWDAKTGKPLMALQGHTGRVLAASFRSDNCCIVTASQDRTARLWEAGTDPSLAVLQGHRREVKHASFSPDSRRVVTSSSDHTAQIWDSEAGRQLTILRGHARRVKQASFSPDSRFVITASSDTTAGLWDAATGQLLTVLKAHPYWVKQASFSPDGRRILTLSGELTAQLWDAATYQSLVLLRGHTNLIVEAHFSPDSRQLVTASHDQTARLWEVESGRLLAVLSGHTAAVEQASFSRDGGRIVTASRDGSARLWDVASGQPLTVLRGHGDSVSQACFSPDGRRVLTASHDQTARLWDAETGQPVAVLQGHTERLFQAHFSPDGLRILTVSHDGTTRLWEAETAKSLRVLQGHTAATNGASFSPDGSRVITASDDGTARIWKVAKETRSAADLGALLSCRVPLKIKGSVVVPSALHPMSVLPLRQQQS